MGFHWRHRRHRPHAEVSSPFLSEWQPGIEGVIVEVTGSTRLAARLRELGIIPGERIRVLRASCPLIVQVGQSRFGMRRRDAATIRVCAHGVQPSAEPEKHPQTDIHRIGYRPCPQPPG